MDNEVVGKFVKKFSFKAILIVRKPQFYRNNKQ